ncbi:GIY-YIG nuclease family protein [Paenibacillus sp. LjRoot153]|uniref:GIY-YIG nuclease family protein n=1 Tax=Paenibacillus sp. LjRoot153 TaxID=3342270 RepID=UPI003ED14CC8
MDNEKSLEIPRVLSEREISSQRTVALSALTITEDERKWIRQVLSVQSEPGIKPSYFYLKKKIAERNGSKKMTRKDLDNKRKKSKNFTPEMLLEFRIKHVRENEENFPGIYIIYNSVKDMYYVGQAERVLDRAYNHFIKNGGNPEVYKDYCSGDQFSISLIPLKDTSFTTLSELEDNAIRAYDSIAPDGYNINPGNVIDGLPFFKSEEYQEVADLILDKIKETEIFSTLSNQKKRMKYTQTLLLELGVPSNVHFLVNFVMMITKHRKAKIKG